MPAGVGHALNRLRLGELVLNRVPPEKRAPFLAKNESPSAVITNSTRADFTGRNSQPTDHKKQFAHTSRKHLFIGKPAMRSEPNSTVKDINRAAKPLFRPFDMRAMDGKTQRYVDRQNRRRMLDSFKADVSMLQSEATQDGSRHVASPSPPAEIIEHDVANDTDYASRDPETRMESEDATKTQNITPSQLEHLRLQLEGEIREGLDSRITPSMLDGSSRDGGRARAAFSHIGRITERLLLDKGIII